MFSKRRPLNLIHWIQASYIICSSCQVHKLHFNQSCQYEDRQLFTFFLFTLGHIFRIISARSDNVRTSKFGYSPRQPPFCSRPSSRTLWGEEWPDRPEKSRCSEADNSEKYVGLCKITAAWLLPTFMVLCTSLVDFVATIKTDLNFCKIPSFLTPIQRR